MNPPRPIRKPGAHQEGAVLILVLWVLALLSVIILSWAQEWRTEIKLAANYRDNRQCRRLAEAGIYFALGKLVQAKLNEDQTQALGPVGADTKPPGIWKFDQTPHVLELPEGRAEIRLADEGGKININMADEKTLIKLFMGLNIPEPRARALTAAIQDWRDKDDHPRLDGAESSYYLSLEPPYPAKNGKLDTIEELAWIKGCGDPALVARLSQTLTVMDTGGSLNLNTAPLEVLLASGIPRDLVLNLLQTRLRSPVQQLEDLPMIASNPGLQELMQRLTFQSSPFFTIISTGMINNKKVRYTIKVVVQLDVGQPYPWDFINWLDDYPG